jgi:hypothetical protein
MTGWPVAVGLAGGVPASSSDVPKLQPGQPQGQKSPTFLKILNKKALLRIAQIFYQKETRATHTRALHVPTLSKPWRTCHSSRYAMAHIPCGTRPLPQSRPVRTWFWTQRAGGRACFLRARGAMGGVWRRRICVRTSEICVKIYN